jgi:hypothetical protein
VKIADMTVEQLVDVAIPILSGFAIGTVVTAIVALGLLMRFAMKWGKR